mgnify:CR=1 FL=1
MKTSILPVSPSAYINILAVFTNSEATSLYNTANALMESKSTTPIFSYTDAALFASLFKELVNRSIHAFISDAFLSEESLVIIDT